MSTDRRTVSITHLVFGLIFIGIAALWTISAATGVDLPRSAVGIPAVLIVAGLIGLSASLRNSRRNEP